LSYLKLTEYNKSLIKIQYKKCKNNQIKNEILIYLHNLVLNNNLQINYRQKILLIKLEINFRV